MTHDIVAGDFTSHDNGEVHVAQMVGTLLNLSSSPLDGSDESVEFFPLAPEATYLKNRSGLVTQPLHFFVVTSGDQAEQIHIRRLVTVLMPSHGATATTPAVCDEVWDSVFQNMKVGTNPDNMDEFGESEGTATNIARGVIPSDALGLCSHLVYELVHSNFGVVDTLKDWQTALQSEIENVSALHSNATVTKHLFDVQKCAADTLHASNHFSNMLTSISEASDDALTKSALRRGISLSESEPATPRSYPSQRRSSLHAFASDSISDVPTTAPSLSRRGSVLVRHMAPAMIKSVEEHGDDFAAALAAHRRFVGHIESVLDHSAQLNQLHDKHQQADANLTLFRLTALQSVFFPITVVTGWFGMNFKNMYDSSCLSLVFRVVVVSHLSSVHCVACNRPELEFENSYFYVAAALGLYFFMAVSWYFKRLRLMDPT